jgi:hypothetical protein
VTDEDGLGDGKEKPFADGNAKVVDDGSVVFTFDEPKSPTEVVLQLRDSPEVTVAMLDATDEPIKTIVSSFLSCPD